MADEKNDPRSNRYQIFLKDEDGVKYLFVIDFDGKEFLKVRIPDEPTDG